MRQDRKKFRIYPETRTQARAHTHARSILSPTKYARTYLTYIGSTTSNITNTQLCITYIALARTPNYMRIIIIVSSPSSFFLFSEESRGERGTRQGVRKQGQGQGGLRRGSRLGNRPSFAIDEEKITSWDVAAQVVVRTSAERSRASAASCSWRDNDDGSSSLMSSRARIVIDRPLPIMSVGLTFASVTCDMRNVK